MCKLVVQSANLHIGPSIWWGVEILATLWRMRVLELLRLVVGKEAAVALPTLAGCGESPSGEEYRIPGYTLLPPNPSHPPAHAVRVRGAKQEALGPIW